MFFRSSIKNFTIRKLAMHPEQGTERTVLIPTRHLFPPFFKVLCVWFFKLWLYCKTTDIHGPVRNAGHGKIDARRYLCFHIMPAGSNISAPDSGSVTL